MERFFLASLFCFFLFIASGCQKADQFDGVETLSADESEIVVEPRWFKVAGIRVENAAARSAEVHVGTVGIVKKGAKKVECKLLQDKPEETEKWFPLSLKFFSPNQPGKKLSKAFADTLSFSRAKQSESLFKFLVDFKKDTFQFVSLWQVSPYLAIDEEGRERCSAKAEICTKYEDVAGNLSCSADWRWLKEIVAIPDVYAYLTGGGEKLTGIKGVFYSLAQNGDVKEQDPVVLK